MIGTTRTIDGVEYAPDRQFRVIAEGGALNGWVPVVGASQGWSQKLHVGAVIVCLGYGRGMGSDPGYGVHWTSDEVAKTGAFLVDFWPSAGGIWNFHPAAGYLEPVEVAAEAR